MLWNYELPITPLEQYFSDFCLVTAVPGHRLFNAFA